MSSNLVICYGWGLQDSVLISERAYATRDRAERAALRYIVRHDHAVMNHFGGSVASSRLTVAPGGRRYTIGVYDDPIITYQD